MQFLFFFLRNQIALYRQVKRDNLVMTNALELFFDEFFVLEVLVKVMNKETRMTRTSLSSLRNTRIALLQATRMNTDFYPRISTRCRI